MGYCKPIPAGAQKRLDEQTKARLRDMHARGEKVRTLYDMQVEERDRQRIAGTLKMRFK